MKIDKRTKKLLSDPGKRRAWVKYQIHMTGVTMADIARAANVRRQCLYQAFDAPYPRMEKVIADHLGVSPKTLFPERYDSDGLPNRRMGRRKNSITKSRKNTTSGTVRNVHERTAA